MSVFSHRLLSQLALIVGLSSTAGLMGWIPDLSLQTGTLRFSNAAWAQADFTSEEIDRFVRANLAIEPKRIQALREVANRMQGKPSPRILCHKPETLDALPQGIREIAVNYCNEAKRITEDQGLPVERFNQILTQMVSKPAVRERVEAAACRLNPKMQVCQK